MQNKMEFFQALRSISEQALLNFDEIVEVLQDVLFKVFHSKYDPDAELELKVDLESQEFLLINHSKEVVEDDIKLDDSEKAYEINLKDALKIKPDAQIGDLVSEPIDFNAYSRLVAGQVKQLLMQRIREKTKENIFERYKHLEKTLIQATPKKIAKFFVQFELNTDKKIKAFMPLKHRNPLQPLSVDSPIEVFIEEILPDAKDFQIIVSTAAKEIVENVFKKEIPEIADGIIEIKKIVRAAGFRSKVIVDTKNENIDALGSCVGPNGVRINNIVKSLFNERIDVIAYINDEVKLLTAAMSPSKVVSVNKKSFDEYVVVVPDRQYSLAIGKSGTNVRLAAEIVGKKVDLMNVETAKEKNIELLWNGNLSESQLGALERGESVQTNWNRSSNSRYGGSGFRINNDFEKEIFEFQDEIMNEETQIDDNPILEPKQNTKDLFSDEEIAKMQDDFLFDEELANFNDSVADFDDNNGKSKK